MKVYSLSRGGISYEDPTVPPRVFSGTAFLPGISLIPLVDDYNNRVYPLVSIGDTVREGMLIGRSKSPGTANIHATVPGRIVRLISWKMAGGQNIEALVIRMEGSFEKLGKQEELYSWDGMLPYDLHRLIGDYGIVEMEGSGLPVSEIISSFRKESEPFTLVVRCVFDDPWLAADYVLCRERMKAVVEGSRIIARIIRASKIIFAVSHHEKKLGEEFIYEAGNWSPPSSLVLVGSKYPQRNRRELEQALKQYARKEEIDLGSLMILGPATLAAVHDAIRIRKPIMDRYIAVGGSAVKNPQVLKVRIGTRIAEVFNECGGFTGTPRRIALGSPLAGRAVVNLDEPILKTSYALFAYLEKQKKGINYTCINCGECRNVCPVGLEPDELYKQSMLSEKLTEGIFISRAENCHGCSCCNVVCPSMLPLSSAIMDSAGRKMPL